MTGVSVFLGFLTLLPKQILVNNYLSGLSLLAIATNCVSICNTTSAQWNVRFIRYFMILFGLISTLFDLVIFAILLWVFNASPDLFRTGWFLVPLLTEIGIISVIRTRGSVFE